MDKEPPQNDFSTPDLPQQLCEELRAALNGDVYLRDNPDYLDYTKMFNGNIKTSAKAVVCPVDSEDVSKIILFCGKHGLSPSVKAGGYGTAGWAVAGDIVLDMSRITDLDLEIPKEDGSFTSLRDMAPSTSRGKRKAVDREVASSRSGKRRREEDTQLRSYDNASRPVALFLRGPAADTGAEDGPSPAVRRRLDPALDMASGQLSGESNSGSISPSTPGAGAGLSLAGSIQSESSASTNVTSAAATAAGSPSSAFQDAAASSGADPFGYLDDTPGDRTMQVAGVSGPRIAPSAYRPPVVTSSWDIGAGSLLVPAGAVAPSEALLTQAIPIHRHAYVTFGAGKRQKEIDQFTAVNALEATSLSGQRTRIPYHVPFAAHPTGSSVVTLAGFGFLSRLHGLSVDNIVEVEMVLADGRIVFVSEQENQDLWWALRGAGTAFGVVTRYKARAYPVPVVFAGNLIYRFHKATAPSLIKHFRDCIKGAPRELYANVILTAGPAGKDSLVVIQICYVGPKEKGIEYLQAITSWDGERCLLNEVDEKAFLDQQDSVAQVLRGKAGRQWFIRSALITSLPDEVVNSTVLEFADSPVGCTWLFELAGGAIADFEDTCLPKAQREAAFTVAALHQWEMGVDDPRCIAAAEQWIKGTLGAVSTGGPYPSFVARHEPPARVMACYGAHWARLVHLKRAYDPANVFRNTFWPLDVAGDVVDPRTHEPATP